MFNSLIKTALGNIEIIADDNFIKEIKFIETEITTKENTCTKKAAKQLSLYFDNKLKQFDLPLAPKGTAFQNEVWQHLQEIEFAKTCSYLDLSLKLGDKNKVRAVGNANSKNPIAIVIPCHRVIGKNGNLVGYAGGLERKKWLIQFEKGGLQQSLF